MATVLERLRAALTGDDDLEKARKPPMPEEEEDPPAPSEDDVEEDAAPDKPAPPEDPEDDEEGDANTAPPAGGDEGEGEPEDDEEEGEPEDDEEDDLKQKVLQRSQEDPDFFKSLVATEEGRLHAGLVEGSQAVAYMTDVFASIVDDLVAENKALRKSVAREIRKSREDAEVIGLLLEKSLKQQEEILKSLAEGNDIVKSQSRQPSRKVGMGLGALKTPERIDPLDERKPPSSGPAPLDDSERGALMKRKPKLLNLLMKSVQEEEIDGDIGGRLISKLSTAEGIREAETWLQRNRSELYKSLAS